MIEPTPLLLIGLLLILLAVILNRPPAATTPASVADAVEIAQTCTLAGRTDLIAGFLEAQASPAKVRSHCSRRRPTSPEITSRIAPTPRALYFPPTRPADRRRQADRGAIPKKEI